MCCFAFAVRRGDSRAAEDKIFNHAAIASIRSRTLLTTGAQSADAEEYHDKLWINDYQAVGWGPFSRDQAQT